MNFSIIYFGVLIVQDLECLEGHSDVPLVMGGCLPWPRTRNCNISTDNSTPEGRFSSYLKYVYDVDDCSDDYDVQRHLVWLEPCLVPSMFDGSI